MGAAKLDIELEEKSDFTKELTYRDSDGNLVDVTNYGAAIVFSKDKDTPPFYTGYASDSDTPILVGGTNGIIELQVPHTHYDDLNFDKGRWELYIFPTVGDISDRPKRLIEGKFYYSRSLLDV